MSHGQLFNFSGEHMDHNSVSVENFLVVFSQDNLCAHIPEIQADWNGACWERQVCQSASSSLSLLRADQKFEVTIKCQRKVRNCYANAEHKTLPAFGSLLEFCHHSGSAISVRAANKAHIFSLLTDKWLCIHLIMFSRGFESSCCTTDKELLVNEDTHMYSICSAGLDCCF